MSYRYLQSVDRMREEIEETWEVRDLVNAISHKPKLRYNLDLIIHELATHICHDRRRDIQEYHAECRTH